MKKNRRGVLLTSFAEKGTARNSSGSFSAKTTTLGIRNDLPRYTLARSSASSRPNTGRARKKGLRLGVTREKPEYEDLARLARERYIRSRRYTWPANSSIDLRRRSGN